MTPELEIMLRPYMITHTIHPILSGDPIGAGVAILISLIFALTYFNQRNK